MELEPLVERYIEDNFKAVDEEIRSGASIAEVCAEHGLFPKSLKQYYKNRTGKTITEYRMRSGSGRVIKKGKKD